MGISRAVLFRRFGWILAYVVLGIGASYGIYTILVSAFSLTAIEVVGSNITVAVDEKKLPHTLLFFPADKIRAQLLQENPILSDIEFKKKYPHTLVIVPKLRRPAVILYAQNRTVWLDEKGIVLGDADEEGSIPRLRIPVTGLRVGQILDDPRVTVSLAVLTGIGEAIPIQEIVQEEDASLRAISDKVSILFTQDADPARILATLQTLHAGFRIKGTLPTRIDLRYDKPIVTF